MNLALPIIVGVAIGLYACNSGIGYVATNYGVQVGEIVTTKYGEYKVWDKPDQKKMLVSPTASQIIAKPEIVHEDMTVEGGQEAEAAREAARTWFSQKSKPCKIITAKEVAHPEFEMTYSCS